MTFQSITRGVICPDITPLKPDGDILVTLSGLGKTSQVGQFHHQMDFTAIWH